MTPEQLPFDGGETPDIYDEYTFYTEDEFHEAIAEYETEYTAQLETIARLKEALRHIHMTAAKATSDTYAHAVGWIEVKAAHILKETAEPLTPDESETT